MNSNLTRDYDLLRILGRHLRTIAFFSAVGLVGAVVYQLMAPKAYYSDCEILVEYQNTKLPASGGQPDPEAVLVNYKELLDTHVEIISSERIVRKAVETDGLDQLPVVIAEVAQLKTDETAVDYILGKLTAYAGGGKSTSNARMITIGFSHSDPKEGAIILQAVVDEYQRFLAEELGEGIEAAQGLIAEANVELEFELHQLEQEYIRFREKTPVFYEQNSLFNRHVKNLSALEQEIADVNIEITKAEARVALMNDISSQLASGQLREVDALALLGDEAIDRIGLIMDIDNRAAQSEAFQAELPVRTEAAKAESDVLLSLLLKEKSLSQLYGNGSEELQSVRSQIADVRKFVNDQKQQLRQVDDRSPKTPLEFSETYLEILTNDLQILKERSQKLEEIAQKEEEKAQSVAAHEVREQTLKAALDRKTELYKLVLRNLADLNLIKDFNSYTTRVMSLIEPGDKVWPKSKFSLPAGLFLGTLLGLCVAFFREVNDDRFQTGEALGQQLRLNMISEVEIDSWAQCNELTVRDTPHSEAAEALRTVRSTLLLQRRQNPNLKTVQIASPTPTAAAPYVAANLAVSLANTGGRVLLIDADLRQPAIKQIFQLRQGPTLNQVLKERKLFANGLINISPNLQAFVSESDLDLAGQIFANGQFEELLSVMSQQFDWIVINSPPVSKGSDARTIAQWSDSTIVALTPQSSSATAITEALQRLREFGDQVKDAVILKQRTNSLV